MFRQDADDSVALREVQSRAIGLRSSHPGPERDDLSVLGSVRGGFPACVGERLVHDLPLAVEARQREEVGE